MAWEVPGVIVSVAASTGLKQNTFCVMGTAGKVTKPPTAGPPVLGVIYDSGTTGSTSSRQYVSVQVSGVAKVKAPASTVAVGDLISASSLGEVAACAGQDYIVGQVVSGSSGAARLVSVALVPGGRYSS